MFDEYAHPTPLDAPILCQIRTGGATGSRLIGTIVTRLGFSLEDVRALLCGLAGRARGDTTARCGVAVHGAPVNVGREEFEKSMLHPLHPFDLGSPFLFVRRGGCVPVGRRRERKFLLVDAFPRLPRAWGVSSAAGWVMEPPPPLVRIMARPGRHTTAPDCRPALAVLFVAQEELGNVVLEQVAVERHVMQQSLYGHPRKPNEFNALLNQWNGNVKDCFGRTILHECVYLGLNEAVAHLVSLPFIRINEQDAQGKTPLHIAVRSDNEFIISQLLGSGADVFVADNLGDTALHIALGIRSDRAVELLCERMRAEHIEASRLSSCKNNIGLSPVEIFRQYSCTFLQLCEKGDVVAIRSFCGHYLFLHESINECDQLLCQSALHIAAAFGHVDIIRFLLDEMLLEQLKDKKCMLNARLQTPMHLAAERGHLFVVELLHKRFPWCLSAQDITGATPLIAALRGRMCHTSVVDFLLSSSLRGAVAPDVCDNSGMGALHMLCELGMTRAANSLIVDHGANVNLAHQLCDDGVERRSLRYLIKTRRAPRLSKRPEKTLRWQDVHKKQLGITPLLCSIRGRRSTLSTVEMLLTHGAGTRGDEIIELLFYLVKNAHYDLADRILASGKASLMRTNELLCLFCKLKHSAGIRWCTERSCCRFNSHDDADCCPLMISAGLGDADAVNLFLACGADPNITAGGSTPLLVAIKGGHDAVVGCLVRAGALLTSADSSWSALRVATERGSESIVRALLGLRVLPAAEVFSALVHAMENVRTRESVTCERVCMHLASFLDISAGGSIHPTELFHLAASRSLFGVVKVLIDKFHALPRSTLQEIIDSSPAPPVRSYVLIEPMMQSSRAKLRSLYTPPKSFRRLVVDRQKKGVMFHRLRLRDVFSYCAEANEGALLESLFFDVGLKPWPGPDYRGWNAADYAAANQRCSTLRMFLVFGLAPLCRHGMRCGATRTGALFRSLAGVGAGASDKDLLSFVLCRLASMREVALVRQILIDTCNRYGVPDLSGAGGWLDEVILSCVNSRCLDLLLLLKSEFNVTLTGRLSSLAQPLLLATARSDLELVSYLIHHGARADEVGTIPATDAFFFCRDFKKFRTRTMSSLWLGAQLGNIAIMEVLLSAGHLRPERCTDTEGSCCDALRALIDGTACTSLQSRDSSIARGVALLARAGHMFTSPSIMRSAARRGLVQTVVSLVECYGLQTVTEDITSDGVCSLHYLVGKKKLVAALTSLLASLVCSANPDEVEASRNFLTAVRTKKFEVNPVDYAFRAGCEEGVLFLLSVGVCGTGGRNNGGRCHPSISRIIELCLARRRMGWEDYTVLHAAVELRCEDIAQKILNVVVALRSIEGGLTIKAGCGHGKMPSFSALVAFYLNGGSSCFRSFFSLLDVGATPPMVIISPCDFIFLIFGNSCCHGEYNKDVVARSALGGGLEHALRLTHDSFLPMEFIHSLLSRHRRSFCFANRSFVITELTPLCCALVAGELSWVQLLVYSGVSTSNCGSVIARRRLTPVVTRMSTRKEHAGGGFGSLTVADRRSRRGKTDEQTMFVLCDERYKVSPLLLCLAIIVEGAISRDANLLARQSDIMRFLLSCDKCLRWEEVDLLAIVLTKLMLWDLFETVVQAAVKHLIADSANEQFFSTITESDIPLVFKRVIGSARHVMHSSARCAPSEILVLAAKHSRRADIEQSCDARGKTCLFHAFSRSQRFAIDILMGLHLDSGTQCCKATGRTFFMLYCQRGLLPLATGNFFVEKGKIDSRDVGGNTALLLAAAAGRLEVVEHLLASGADPSIRNDRGMTAVMAAAFAGHDHIAVFLAEKFAKMDDFFSQKTTILHCAAVGGCWRVVEMVLKRVESMDILSEDDNGFTAVHLAYAFGRARVLGTLLSTALRKGIEPSSSLFIERQLFACSSALPRYGWLSGVLCFDKALVKESSQRTFAHSAVRQGELTCGSATSFRWFRISLLFWCVCNRNAVGVCVLKDMNIADDCCALHEAARRGYLDIVELLLKLEMSNPNCLDRFGRSPFEVAAAHKHVACAAFLLEHTTLDLKRLKTPAPGGVQSALHHMASTASAETLVALVDKFQQKSGASWPFVALELYNVLGSPDLSGMTAFESAVAMGNPSTFFCVAQLLCRLALASGQKTSFTVSNSVILSFCSISPTVRVLLYDVFNIGEVAMSAGFGQKDVGRLTFADVRLIGINMLKEDAFCASDVSAIFTLDHEIKVASSLLKGLSFRIRYKPSTFEATSSAQKSVQLLQWMASSLILSNYESLVSDTSINTVELELVSHRSAEFVNVSGGHLRHSVYVDSCQLLTPDICAKIPSLWKRETAMLQSDAEVFCQALMQKVQKLPHPLLTQAQVSVEWGCSRSDMRPEVVTRLIHDGLARVDAFLDGELKNSLEGVCIADIDAVTGALLRKNATRDLHIIFRYTSDVLRPGPCDGYSTVFDGTECVILFNNYTVQDVVSALHCCFYNRVLVDVKLVGISFARDVFMERAQKCLGRELVDGDGAAFKLEIEGGSLDKLPLHVLEAMMTDAAEALTSLTSRSLLDLQADFHSCKVVGDSLKKNFCSVVVLFSPKRYPFVEFARGNLVLCFNLELSPTRHEIYDRLRCGTVADELLRLKAELCCIIAAVNRCLQDSLPSAKLVFDFASLFEEQDDEFVLSALSLLCHNSGAFVLQPFIDGVSIGWDTTLGDMVRRHVRELTLVCEASAESASCVLYDSGNFVYYCPLYCVEKGVFGKSSWHILSAEQVASLLLMQLSAVDHAVLELVDTTRPFACWSQAHGRCTRLVDAGSSRGLVSIMTRNILNQSLGCGVANSRISFFGEWRSVKIYEASGRVRFTAPTRSGYYYQHIFMNGQPLSNSPFCIRVRPLTVSLAHTVVLSGFNMVVLGRPFRIVLLLRDKYGNRIETLQRVDVESATSTGVAKIVSWRRTRVDVIEVEAVVDGVCGKRVVLIRLRGTGGDEFDLPFAVESVTKQAGCQLCLPRRGLTPAVQKAFSGSATEGRQ